jgi:hypothetical protein
MQKRPQLLQILLWCVLAFHVFITAHAFYTFGFAATVSDFSSWHPYILLVYSSLWLGVCLNFTIIKFTYLALSLAQFLISTFAKNIAIKEAFGATLFPIDLVFSLIIGAEIMSKMFSKPKTI